MTCQYQHEYKLLCSGEWADPNPDSCPCQGRGAIISDLDTEHGCPIHGGYSFIENCRNFYREAGAASATIFKALHGDFSEQQRTDMVQPAEGWTDANWFRKQCELSAEVCDMNTMTPNMWCRAAERVWRNLESGWADRIAKAAGFSCRLEMDLQADADSSFGH